MRRLLACLIVAVLAASACTSRGSTSTPRPSDTRLPPASVPATRGEIVGGSIAALRSTLESLQGRPVVVNYWATWCEPCKAEMPRVVDAAKRYSGRVGFLGVNVMDDTGAAEEFVRHYRVPFRSVADPDGKIQRDEKILGLPVTQFYGSDGKLAFVHQGEIKADELEEKIEEVLRLRA